MSTRPEDVGSPQLIAVASLKPSADPLSLGGVGSISTANRCGLVEAKVRVDNDIRGVNGSPQLIAVASLKHAVSHPTAPASVRSPQLIAVASLKQL